MTQQLSAAIAASGNEWRKPGVRVVDPVSGIGLRLFVQRSWCFDANTKMMSAKKEIEIEHRAIAAGPDWLDDATAGCLAGLLTAAQLREVMGDCYIGGLDFKQTVARAYLASKGAM